LPLWKTPNQDSVTWLGTHQRERIYSHNKKRIRN